MIGHTPGPWEHSIFGNVAIMLTIHGDGEELTSGWWDSSHRGTMEANGRLMSAAPELLAALTHLLEDYEREWGSELTDEWYPDVRAAIAKAKGTA